MKVILAEEYGFCNGVRRALARLDKAIADNPDTPVCSIGEIIHNNDVVQKYEDLGVTTVQSINDLNNTIGVVRAHGLPNSVVENAIAEGRHIIDATCPHVRLISNLIKKEIDKGTAIYILGEPGHPEVIAATADFGDRVTLIDHTSFDPETFTWPGAEAVLLSQTTMSEDTFAEVVNQFVRHCRSLTVHNTICQSTRVRQRSAVELAKKVDVMIVVGGKNSSNTKRLAELCKPIVRTITIERASDLDSENLDGLLTAGVTAGASTPDEIVQEVITRLSQ